MDFDIFLAEMLSTMPPQTTCASALPGKTGKHEDHTFHSIGLLHAQCTCALSSWKKNCYLWCVW